MDSRDTHFNRSRYDPYNPPFHRHNGLSGPPDDYYPHPNPRPPPPPPPPRQHRNPRDHFPDERQLPYFNHFPDRPPSDPPARGPHRPVDPWMGPNDDRRVREFESERYWPREDKIYDEDFRVRASADRPVRRFEQFPSDPRPQEFEYSPRAPQPVFVPRPEFARPSVAEVPGTVGPPMGRETGYREDRYQEDRNYRQDRYQESHYVGNKGKRKMVDMGRESHYVGNVGKKRNFNGGNFQYNNEWKDKKRPVQKSSAFGRIQSGVSVWNRIAEKPAAPTGWDEVDFVKEKPASPNGWSGLSEFVKDKPASPKDWRDFRLIEEELPDAEALDLSYKENVIVSKAVVPPSSSLTLPPECLGREPKVVTPKDREKMNKAAQKREKVVVTIASNTVGQGWVKGVTNRKKLKGKSLFKGPNHSEESEKMVRSSNELVSGTSIQPLSTKLSDPPQEPKLRKDVIYIEPSSGFTPQSSSKRREVASAGKAAVGVSPKGVSMVASSPNLIEQIDGFLKEICSSSKLSGQASLEASFKLEGDHGNTLCDGSFKPLSRVEGIKDCNDPKGSAKNGVSPQNSLKQTVSPSSEVAIDSRQILSKTDMTPLLVSGKIKESSTKPLSLHSLPSSVEPASNASNPKMEKSPQVSNSSFEPEKLLSSSTKTLTGSKLKSLSKRKIVAFRKPAIDANKQQLLFKDTNPVYASNDAKEMKKVEDLSIKSSGHSSFQNSSKKIIASTGKPTSASTSKPSFKRSMKVSAAKKSVGKRSANSIVVTENDTSKDRGQEVTTIKDKPIDALTTQLCEPGPMMITRAMEDNTARRDVSLSQAVKEKSISNLKMAENSCCPMVSECFIKSDPTFEPSAEVTKISTQSKGITSVDNDTAETPSELLSQAVDDVRNVAQSDIGLPISSYDEFSSAFPVGHPAAAMSDATESSTGVGHVNSGGHVNFEVRGAKRKRQILEEENQILDLPAVSKEFQIPVEGMAEDGIVLEAGSLVIAQSSPDDDIGQGDGAPSLVSTEQSPPSDVISVPEEGLLVHMNDRTVEIKQQPLPLCISQIQATLDVSNVKDASNLMDTGRSSNSNVSESNRGCSKSDGINNHDEKPTTNCGLQLEETLQSQEPAFDRTQLLLTHESKGEITADAKLVEVKYSNGKTIGTGALNNVPNRINSVSLPRGMTRKDGRNKTWHRSDTSSASQICGDTQFGIGNHKDVKKKQSPKKLTKVMNSSYVRKGNSLIRKPTTVVQPPIPPLGPAASSIKSNQLTERSSSLGQNVESSNQTTCNPSSEILKTPALPLGSKLPDVSTDLLKDSSLVMSEDPVSNAGIEALGTQPESQSLELVSGSVHNHSMPSGISSELLTKKRMIYVKHKSNQLVAASQTAIEDPSSNLEEKAQKLSTSTLSDLYYRRNKNQLILNGLSSDSQYKQDVDNANLDNQGSSKVSSLECRTAGPFQNRLDKVLRKTYKHSKYSRVWMLNGGQPSKKGFTAANLWKVTPYLSPWKRTQYCPTSASRHALSLSRKLQFTRKRNTVYKVSIDGYSLRKTGVVSIGGASLKWSKSIDKHSKKANEEATMAVAEVERRKREVQGSTSVQTQTRKRNRSCLSRKSTFGIQLKQGERIFRIGSVRYKMDPSKRTLIRIPDDQSSPADQQATNNAYVPRRLLIGNDEYIRIGNGNQLVRDPKKLVRILASEKVRWSLHTARSRLAKKKQYCQFFTRFGKCNKSAGKCPYMHDVAKVAICTKFLRGVCSDSNCKLTHKVLPERMPDCSYFLLGLCTNVDCLYRHVHVNPNASVCDGFLRGYCADGDECCKKHSYVCPHFEATGKCDQGSKCKLHHPKSRKKSKKRKRQQCQTSSKGRYFGSTIMKTSETSLAGSGKDDRSADALCSDEWGPEFIHISPESDYDDNEANSPEGVSPKKKLEDDFFDAADLDSIIKPIRIMNRIKLTNTGTTSHHEQN